MTFDDLIWIKWFETKAGEQLISSVGHILLVLLLASLLRMGLNALVRKFLLKSHEQNRFQRARTLIPVFRNAISVTIWIMAIMMILSSMGVDIAPLLASAGVVGLAIGFGAQAVVKDAISGLLIVLDGTIHLGDRIEAAGKMGVVEHLTIRNLVLRGDDKIMHIIPFGTVGVISNFSRGE